MLFIECFVCVLLFLCVYVDVVVCDVVMIVGGLIVSLIVNLVCV